MCPICEGEIDISRRVCNDDICSHREYRFRLVGITTNNDAIRSDFTVVKTHKDRYENTAFYQNYQGNAERDRVSRQSSHLQYDLECVQVGPPVLQRVYDDEHVVELSWKYPSHEHDTVTYTLEGQPSHYTATSTLVDGNDTACSLVDQQQPPTPQQQQWRQCYKGPNTSTIVHDPQLSMFRVQAVSKRGGASQWSDACWVQRQRATKRHVTAANNSRQSAAVSSHPQTPSTAATSLDRVAPSTAAIKTAVETPTRKTSAVVSTPLASTNTAITAAPERPPSPIKAPACSPPKFADITQSSMSISWRLGSAVDTAAINKRQSLLYELQRVDKQPMIVHAGAETQTKLQNLRAVENVQVGV